MRSITKKINLYFGIGIFSIFVFWIIGSNAIDNSYLLPDPLLTVKAFKELVFSNRTYMILSTSLSRLFITVLISLLIAIITGSLSILSKRLESIISPWISLIKTLPLAVVIIIFLVYLRANLSVYFIVGVVLFPLIYEGFTASFKMIKKDLLDEIKMLNNYNLYIVVKVFISIFISSLQ